MKKFNIPIFKLKFEFKTKIKFLKGAWDILSSGRPLGESKYVEEFEKRFAEMCGTKHAISVSNGTTALELALKAVGVKGKKVLMPSNTFFATSVAVTNAGGEIELLDMDPNNFSLSYEDLKIRINKEVGAVIVVHIGGIISNKIDKIKELCEKYNVPLIEDAAHAHFSSYGIHKAGAIGDIGCFSFFPTKVMTTGEGGMITTNNEEYYKKMKSLKNFGRDLNDAGLITNSDGNNFKISEFTGLLGCIELDRVYERIEKRKFFLDIYSRNLEKTKYKIVKQRGRGICAYYKIILITPMESDWLKNYCKNYKISLTGEVYKIPIHKQPLYKENFLSVDLPNTDYYCLHHICPPLYPELKVSEVEYICDVLKKALVDYEEQSSQTHTD